MSYGYTTNYRRSGGNGNYGQRQYRYGNSGYNNTYGRQPKKHSGSKYRPVSKNGSPVTTGWNYSRRDGLVTFLATVYKGTSSHKSKSGREWLNVMVKVSPKMQKPYIVSGLMDSSNGKVIINDLGLVLNPNAPNGGYCGRFGKK